MHEELFCTTRQNTGKKHFPIASQEDKKNDAMHVCLNCIRCPNFRAISRKNIFIAHRYGMHQDKLGSVAKVLYSLKNKGSQHYRKALPLK